MRVRVEIKKVESKDNPELKGFASLNIGDVAVRDVAIKEINGKNGKFLGYQIQGQSYTSRNGEKGFTPNVELSSSDPETAKKVNKELLNLIKTAYESKEVNERGRYVAANDIADITFDDKNIRAYVSPVTDRERLKGHATVYVGNVLKINNVSLFEHTNKETQEKFLNVTFPNKSIEKEDGTREYKDLAFPTTKDLAIAISDKVKEQYEIALERETAQESKSPEKESEEEL